MVIDLGRAGAEGVEAVYENNILYFHGVDHESDILLQFSPFAGKAEIKSVALVLSRVDIQTVRLIHGHSWGGCLAQIAATKVYRRTGRKVPCASYGGKRAPRQYACEWTRLYRHRGEVVPYLPPTRPKVKNEIVFGVLGFPWDVHDNYGPCIASEIAALG